MSRNLCTLYERFCDDEVVCDFCSHDLLRAKQIVATEGYPLLVAWKLIWAAEMFDYEWEKMYEWPARAWEQAWCCLREYQKRLPSGVDPKCWQVSVYVREVMFQYGLVDTMKRTAEALGVDPVEVKLAVDATLECERTKQAGEEFRYTKMPIGDFSFEQACAAKRVAFDNLLLGVTLT